MLKRSLFIAGIVLLIASLSGLIVAHLPPKKVTMAFAFTAAPGVGFHYTVRWGDSIFSIARRFGTTVEAIATANDIDPEQLLQVGQKLIIPSAGLTPTPISPPLTPTGMPTSTPVPTPTLTNVPTPYPPTLSPTPSIMPTPTPTPARMIKVEYPPKMEIGRSYHINLSLVKGGIYTPTVEKEYTVKVATPEPVGTPGAPLEKQFGDKYVVVAAIAKMTAINFDYKLVDEEEEAKSITDKVDWKWIIKPKPEAEGDQEIGLTLYVCWEPISPEFPEIPEKKIWSTTLKMSVQESWFTIGQINILGTLGSLVGPALTIPWLYDRWKERQEKKRGQASS